MVLNKNHAIVNAKYGTIKKDQKDHQRFFKLTCQSDETESFILHTHLTKLKVPTLIAPDPFISIYI